jgi:hypothetical protein
MTQSEPSGALGRPFQGKPFEHKNHDPGAPGSCANRVGKCEKSEKIEKSGQSRTKSVLLKGCFCEIGVAAVEASPIEC